LAASLREAGFKVIAKTTGSKPVLILPDNKELEISRRGTPSILEGKKILKIGAKHRVDALVAELMSIQPESGFAESVLMMKPNILVITNVRLDHLAQMGPKKAEVARSLSASIPPQCNVFIPQEEYYPVFEEAGKEMSSKILSVASDSHREKLLSAKKILPSEFEENLGLTLAVCEFLGIKKKDVLQGIKKAHPDFGSLKVWKAEIGIPPRSFHLVSAFAANDPQSTQKVLSKVEEVIPFEKKRIIGLLNLRKDRGDRTLQWAEALKKRYFRLFHKLVLIGGHAHALKRKLRPMKKTEISVIKEKSPPEIMTKISEEEEGEAILIGMGNMGGAGQELVQYWNEIGRPYDF